MAGPELAPPWTRFNTTERDRICSNFYISITDNTMLKSHVSFPIINDLPQRNFFRVVCCVFVSPACVSLLLSF